MSPGMRDLLDFLRLKIAFGTVSFGLIAFLLFNNISLTGAITAVSIFCLTVFGYTYNSITDVREDKINYGKVNQFAVGRKGKIISILFLLIGALSSYFVNHFILSVYLITTFLGWFYSYFRIKRFLLGKNLYIWVLFFLIFVIGTTAPFLSLKIVLFSVIFSFLIFIQSIVADLRDLQGDSKEDLRTLPVVLGRSKTKTIISLLLVGWLVLLFFVNSLFLILLSPFVFLSLFFLHRERPTTAHLSSFLGAHFFCISLVFLRIFFDIGAVF